MSLGLVSKTLLVCSRCLSFVSSQQHTHTPSVQMDSAGASSSPFDSFKSKKVLRSSVSKQHSDDKALGAPHQSPSSSNTPEKPTPPPRRPITRRQPLRSVKQIREAAQQLRKSDLKPSVSSDPLAFLDTTTETPITKPKIPKALPERFEMLDNFFKSLQSAIRLLRLKGSASTFTNISRAVEKLTDRRFTHKHLAQLKFIFPEGIETRKILLRDDVTSCIKPDLDVTFNFSVIQNDEMLESGNRNLQMGKLFRSRLVSYYKSNPERDEVPEEMLPEPFNQSNRVTSSVATINPNSRSVHDTVSQTQPLVSSSHMPQSFKPRFSKQVSDHLRPQVSEHASVKVDCVPIPTSPVKVTSKLLETPIKSFSKKRDLSSMDETPSKLISTPISATPPQASRRPVRSFMTPDEDPITSPIKSTPKKLTKRQVRGSLMFETPVKNKPPPVKRASNDDDDDDIFSGDLLASIKEKEQKAIEENDPAISQAKFRKQMISGLPKLFDSLVFIFIKRSVLTKEELIHTIISCRLDIVDRREVEEQLRLLQELVPEWIYQKMASSGDLLFCVKKISSPESNCKFYKRKVNVVGTSDESGGGKRQQQPQPQPQPQGPQGPQPSKQTTFGIHNLPYDPGERPRITTYNANEVEEIRREYWVQKACQQRNHLFPQTNASDRNRRFVKAWFDEFDWLEYSVKKDNAYCLCCYFFGDNVGQQGGRDAFVSEGFDNWGKKKALQKYVGEVNSIHNKARQKCENLVMKKASIHEAFHKRSVLEESRYQARLRVSCNIAKFLLKLTLPFRGHDESVASLNRGIFLELLEYTRELDEEIRNNLERSYLETQLETYYHSLIVDERFSNLKGIADLSRLMVETGKDRTFPLVYRLLKLTLVLPVATASVERCFSAMKLLKNDLRNRIGDDFLNDALICSVEKEALINVKIENVMER
ncbi:hypothetical protein LXL04_035619 [Taraxacum kok-saghyz]